MFFFMWRAVIVVLKELDKLTSYNDKLDYLHSEACSFITLESLNDLFGDVRNYNLNFNSLSILYKEFLFVIMLVLLLLKIVLLNICYL